MTGWGVGHTRAAAAAFSFLFLLLAAVAWPEALGEGRTYALSSTGASVGRVQHTSGNASRHGSPSLAGGSGNRASERLAISRARLTSLAGGLAHEIASLTGALGNELEHEASGVFAMPKPVQQLVHTGPAFTINNKEGHYVECGDSVADGALSEGINGDVVRAQRFHGQVGDIYVIRCPARCGSYLSYSFVYGCGPYLDGSAICMAGILDGKIGYGTGGDIAIKLVSPVPYYESCFRIVKRYMDVKGATKPNTRGRGPASPPPFKKLWTTFPFQFAEWDKADGAAMLTQGDYRDNKMLTEYRSTCNFPDSTTDIGCAGKRAFQIMNLRDDFNGYDPVIIPDSGTYTGPLLVSIDAPGQRIYYSIDGTSPKGDTDEAPSSAALRYGGPFYINKPGKVAVRTISYSPNYFPGNSNEISAEYDIKDPPGGLPEEPPEIISQKSLPPRVEGQHQQYSPGSIKVLPPKNINDIVIPSKGPVYQIFFAVGESMDEVNEKNGHPCGGANKMFASKINDLGDCEVSLRPGVWYVKVNGLMTGQTPCEGCDPYVRSDATMYGPVMVQPKDGAALPPHFSPTTGSFFTPTGEVDIATVKKMAVLFTLDGSDPEVGSPSTAICGENFEYSKSVITSEYGPKGCEVVLPEGRWMMCAVAKSLECDRVCQLLLNQSLSTSECAGPYYVVPPTVAPLVYPTWEGNDALPIAAGPGEGAGKWLGSPAKLLLKQDDPEAIICFKIKEVAKGQTLDLRDRKSVV